MKKIFLLSSIFVLAIYLHGCLAVESKEYSFRLKSGNSGEGKIKYVNIMRTQDSLATIESDYQELITTYLNGNKPEDEMLGIKNVKKRLFEEDNRLCGEITFDFEDLSKLKFYNYNNKVWCYYISANALNIFGGNETYFLSNGTFGGELFPVVFWEGDQKKFEIKTSITQPSDNTSSMLEIWKKNDGK
jgi:hypothetical protein